MQGALEAPAIVDWKNTHPLLRFVGFENVQVATALATRTPAWAIALVESPNAPLILAGESRAATHPLAGLRHSPKHLAAPHLFPHLHRQRGRMAQPRPRPGHSTPRPRRRSHPPPLPQPEPTATVRLPDGTSRELILDAATREIVFGGTQQRGVYQIGAGTNQFTVCVNLLDAAETDTTPRTELQLGQYARVEAAAAQIGHRELWRWLALLALGVLLFEWWFYHQRTA
ncbi:MAG: hypothetical protein M5U12_15665 [Verrucomicrobia bacterium]|nr:hypothetical protein [Verrucomicrobiota bacterium]